MERETQTIQTPRTNTEVVIHTFITGRESEAIQEPLFKAMSIKPDAKGKDLEMGELNPEKLRESNHLALSAVVKSVGGNTENVVELLLDLPSEDYEFVVEAVEEVTKKK